MAETYRNDCRVREKHEQCRGYLYFTAGKKRTRGLVYRTSKRMDAELWGVEKSADLESFLTRLISAAAMSECGEVECRAHIEEEILHESTIVA